MGSSGFPSTFFILFFFPLFLFGTKLFKESTLFFAIHAQVLFLTAVLELGTQDIECC